MDKSIEKRIRKIQNYFAFKSNVFNDSHKYGIRFFSVILVIALEFPTETILKGFSLLEPKHIKDEYKNSDLVKILSGWNPEAEIEISDPLILGALEQILEIED